MNPIRPHYALIIPALDEAESIGELLRQIPRDAFVQVIVVDNGSQDRTAEIASAGGADVIREARRGYGQACLAGLAALHAQAAAVAFMDADLADDPADLTRLVEEFERGDWELIIGSRALGRPESGALTALQRFGNWMSTRLIRCIWKVSFTDLGPLRMIRREALDRLDLRDRNFGWNVEMQAKAARLRLKVTEIPARYRKRRHGKSKISGTLFGSLYAGTKILWTIYCCWRMPAKGQGSPRTAGP